MTRHPAPAPAASAPSGPVLGGPASGAGGSSDARAGAGPHARRTGGRPRTGAGTSGIETPGIETPGIETPGVETDGAGADAGGAGNEKNLVRSAAKAFAVLRAFDAASPGLTVAEVAGRAGLDRGTAFRLVHTLLHLGYLRPVPGTKRVRLSLKCLELGFLALSSQDLRAHAAPLLRECVPAVADAGSLGTLDGPDVVYLERVGGPARHDVDRRPGRRIRAYGAALGHAQLAFLPEAQQVAALEAAERVKLSERTLTDLDALLARLREVRARGYAVSDGENAYGLRTVAAPVLDDAGAPLAGVSLTIDVGRMSLQGFVALAAPEALRVAGALTQAVRHSAGGIGAGSPREKR